MTSESKKIVSNVQLYVLSRIDLQAKIDFNSFCFHARLLIENPVQRLGATGAGEVLFSLFLFFEISRIT